PGVCGVEDDPAGELGKRGVSGEEEAHPVDAIAPAALEGDVRKSLDVEEVRRAQVYVAIGRAGVDAGRVDDDLDIGAGEVAVLGEQHAPPPREPAANLGDHHVPHREFDAGVPAVDIPPFGRHA